MGMDNSSVKSLFLPFMFLFFQTVLYLAYISVISIFAFHYSVATLYSQKLNKIVDRLLEPDPSNRLTIAGLLSDPVVTSMRKALGYEWSPSSFRKWKPSSGTSSSSFSYKLRVASPARSKAAELDLSRMIQEMKELQTQNLPPLYHPLPPLIHPSPVHLNGSSDSTQPVNSAAPSLAVTSSSSTSQTISSNTTSSSSSSTAPPITLPSPPTLFVLPRVATPGEKLGVMRLNRVQMVQYVCSYIVSVTGSSITDLLSPTSSMQFSDTLSQYVSRISPYHMDIILSGPLIQELLCYAAIDVDSFGFFFFTLVFPMLKACSNPQVAFRGLSVIVKHSMDFLLAEQDSNSPSFIPMLACILPAASVDTRVIRFVENTDLPELLITLLYTHGVHADAVDSILNVLSIIYHLHYVVRRSKITHNLYPSVKAMQIPSKFARLAGPVRPKGDVDGIAALDSLFLDFYARYNELGSSDSQAKTLVRDRLLQLSVTMLSLHFCHSPTPAVVKAGEFICSLMFQCPFTPPDKRYSLLKRAFLYVCSHHGLIDLYPSSISSSSLFSFLSFTFFYTLSSLEMQEKLFDMLYTTALRYIHTPDPSIYGSYPHSILEMLCIDPCPRMKARLPQLISALTQPLFCCLKCSDE